MFVKDKPLTDGDKYKPTPAEEKLLAVLLNPDLVSDSVTDKCQNAGISRQTYYEAMKKPGFMELVQGFRKEMLQAEIQDLIQVGIKEAKNGSYQHWKALMEMAGEYTPKTKTEVATPEGLMAAINVSFTSETE